MVAFNSWTDDELWIARYDGSNWSSALVAEGQEYYWLSLALDSYDNPAVVYLNNSDLMLASPKHYPHTAQHNFEWEIDTVDTGLAEGCDPDVVLSWRVNGPMIAYHDPVSEDLMLATKTADVWSAEGVAETGDVGAFPSIDLDTSSYPHIAYWDREEGYLTHAWFDGADWSDEQLDASALGQGEISLRSYNARRFISYYHAETTSLKLATWDMGTGWTVETVDGAGAENVGYFNSTDVYYQDSSPLIWYRSDTQSVLRQASAIWDGAWDWTIEEIDSAGDPGKWVEGAADAGVFAVSYLDAATDDLKVGVFDGEWNIGAPDVPGSVGMGSSCAWDYNDQLFVSYYDETNTALKIAYMMDGRWLDQTVALIGTQSDPQTAVFAAGRVWIVCYDATSGNLMFFEGMPPTVG